MTSLIIRLCICCRPLLDIRIGTALVRVNVDTFICAFRFFHFMFSAGIRLMDQRFTSNHLRFLALLKLDTGSIE